MTLYDKIALLKPLAAQSAWSRRAYCEIHYAAGMSSAEGHAYDAAIEKALDRLLAAAEENGGAVTRADVLKAEEALAPLSKAAKSYRVHCVGHAHIDMNWLWGYQETAALTIDTFRTVLDLMKEYPDFTFAQSQASTYEIVQKYAPEMLDEIKARVHEGRWEVSASTWVENDKNMPSGESLARHILYTKRYLSKLLDIPAESLTFDFEPDTFGHNVSVPEVCNQGGIKYYYQCRGNSDAEFAYIWRARSGAELLVCREQHWYNTSVSSDMMHDIPQLCAKYGIHDFLYVYGVGDHGGGPTRRDLNTLIEMNSWPIMPTVVFSTYGKFFAALDQSRANFPVREGELNYTFTGCYTSQSRIKMANRIGEDRLYESEWLSAAANAMADAPRRNEIFTEAWKKVLFNHFHDILPGSGVIDTREYAMGQFQNAMAAVNVNANNAMRALAEAIDISSIPVAVDEGSMSEGSGVGFAVNQASHYGLPRAERGVGKKRVFHLFNSAQYDFDGVCEITVWDWKYDVKRAVFANSKGEAAAHKLLGNGKYYWGHEYDTFAVRAKVPAMGYATYTLDEAGIADNAISYGVGDRTDDYSDAPIVLENNRVKAAFDHATMQVISLIDKTTGREMINKPAASFLFIAENNMHGMSAWRVGDRMTVTNLNEAVNVNVNEIDGNGIEQHIRYELAFGERSKLKVTVSLLDNSGLLNFDVAADFHEVGNSQRIPQLCFDFPVAYAVKNYRYDVPFGTLDRCAIEHDVPANSFAAAVPEADADPAIMLISDTKYGFRGARNALELDLIRGSMDPDPYPEYGVHNIRIGAGVAENVSPNALYREASFFVHGIAVCSSRKGTGSLPLDGQLFRVSGNVRVSAVKTPEDCDGLIVRVFDENGSGADFSLTFFKPLSAAYSVDLNENITGSLSVDGNTLLARANPYSVKSVLVKF